MSLHDDRRPADLAAAPALPTHLGLAPAAKAWEPVEPGEVLALEKAGWRVQRVVAVGQESHPVRVGILDRLAEVDELGPADFARELPDWSLAVIAYHFRTLEQGGQIVLCRTQPVRGATAHFFRLPGRARPGEQELWCEHGHRWTRPAIRGRKPVCCPDHRGG